jgi:hypothetical protein
VILIFISFSSKNLLVKTLEKNSYRKTEIFSDNLEIPNFSEKEDKRGSATKRKVEKRFCIKKRATSLFQRCSGHPNLEFKKTI